METPRPKNSSGDKFSFPSMPIQDQEFEFEFEFEFGCVTPDSPNSPADHLFFNGQLLPHAFPFQPTNAANAYSRSTSSVSSKDSLMSSRSNSTNSRSSSCSSARTSISTSEASERKPLSQAKVGSKTPLTKARYEADRPVLTPQYGPSKRWQFITPVPVLSHQVSRRKKVEFVVQEESRAKKRGKEKTGASTGFCRRFFRSFVSACKECHAMEPSTRDSVLQGNMELQ